MLHNSRRVLVIAGLVVAGVHLTGCGQVPTVTADIIKPALVEQVAGSDFNRVVLSEKAAKRLGIQTSRMLEEQVNGVARSIIPYGAVIYGMNGETWVYTSVEPLTYVRHLITVDRIDGDRVTLKNGPPEWHRSRHSRCRRIVRCGYRHR